MISEVANDGLRGPRLDFRANLPGKCKTNDGYHLLGHCVWMMIEHSMLHRGFLRWLMDYWAVPGSTLERTSRETKYTQWISFVNTHWTDCAPEGNFSRAYWIVGKSLTRSAALILDWPSGEGVNNIEGHENAQNTFCLVNKAASIAPARPLHRFLRESSRPLVPPSGPSLASKWRRWRQWATSETLYMRYDPCVWSMTLTPIELQWRVLPIFFCVVWR